MYICMCHGYKEAEIRSIARTGIRTAEEVYAKMGEVPECGRCMDEAQAIIDEEQTAA